MTRTAPLLLAALLALAASCKKTSGNATAEGAPSGAPSASAGPAGKGPTTTAPALLAGDPERGRSLVVKFECSRCHDGTGVASAPFEKHCFQCHQDIVNDKFSDHFKAPADKLAKWKKTSLHYLWAPSFENAGARYKPEFIQTFIQNPHKVRPVMWSSMPRLSITPQEAADVAAYITRGAPKAEPDPVGGDAARGRQVMESKACGTCHVFTGVEDLPLKPNFAGTDQKGKDAIEMAPDLRYTRERMAPAAVVRWILDPTSVRAGTFMPNLKLSEQEAKDAAAYILTTPLAPLVPKPIPKRLPVLERKVTFDDVDLLVLGITCRHCHTNPDIARGDGGPGMTGGFGFIPRKLNLSSYEGVASGFLDEKGQRTSVFAPMKDGTPRLVAALIARQKEEAGQIDPEVRGMPLGLPALTAEQVQVVESWIAQGRPE